MKQADIQQKLNIWLAEICSKVEFQFLSHEKYGDCFSIMDSRNFGLIKDVNAFILC
jgi:hypothetical protein